MKQIGTFLFIALLIIASQTSLQAQRRSYYDLGFPSTKHPYPTNASTTRVNPGIATGSSSGYYVRFGEDIAKLCAKYGISLDSSDPNRSRYPKFRLNVYATQGGFDSVKRLRYEREVQLGIVQSDLRYFASMMYEKEGEPRKKEAWRQIANSIKLILPLYREKIHILVHPDNKGRFQNLEGLLSNEANVNIGSVSSGGMITCLMLEDTITKSSLWNQQHGRATWRPTYYSTEEALTKLIDREIDAAIIVGGTPFPAIKNYGMEYAKKKKWLNFGTNNNAENRKPTLALLPIGPTAKELLCPHDHEGGRHSTGHVHNYVGCYLPDSIKVEDYKFLGDSKDEIPTIGVYSCLVTHSSYGSSTGRDAHKIDWVRHVLYRILTKLDSTSKYGLPSDFGIPRAGDKWTEVKPFPGMASSEKNWEDIYGWPRHEDKILREMMDVWAKGAESPGTGNNSSIVDPITLF